MKLLNKLDNTFWKVYSLEILFAFIFYFISSFFIKKIYSIIIIIQAIGSELPNYENIYADTITNEQAIALDNLVTALSSNFGNLILYTSILAILIFITYVILQSLAWNLLINQKVKSFKSYFWKFTFLSLILFFILVPLIFFIFVSSREFLLSYIFEGIFLKEPFLKVASYFIIFSFIVYLSFNSYVHINNKTFYQAIKTTFKFRKIHNFLIFLVLLIISLFIVRYGLIINSSYISVILQFIIILFMLTFYKRYLIEVICGDKDSNLSRH